MATGWGVIRWLYNEENTASASDNSNNSKSGDWYLDAYVSGDTDPRYKSDATASVSASQNDSTGVQNEGAYFMTTDPYDHDSGGYEGSISKGISQSRTAWLHSPDEVSGSSSASVRPDRDSDADPGNLSFSGCLGNHRCLSVLQFLN